MVLTACHPLGSDAESMRALLYLFLLVGKMLFQPAVLWGAARR